MAWLRTPRNRWQAAGLHLAISAAVGAAVMAVLAFVWYPPPLFMAGGAFRLSMTIIGVDVVLGPLLTLVVYRLGKRSLRFDLACIVALQLSALAYGVNIAAQSRPAWIVALPHRAVVVHANELHPEPTPAAAFARAPWTGPRVVAAFPPADPAEREALLFGVLDGTAADVEHRPGYYQPIEAGLPRLLEAARPMTRLAAQRSDLAPAMLRFARAHGHDDLAQLAYLPLFTRDRELVLVFDRRAGRVLGPLDVAEP